MDFLPGARYVSTIIHVAFEWLVHGQAASLCLSRCWNPALPSFGLAAFPPGNPSFNFPLWQMGLHWCRKEVSMCLCISSSPSSPLPQGEEKKYFCSVPRTEQKGRWIASGSMHQRKERYSFGQGSRQSVQVCKLLLQGSITSSYPWEPGRCSSRFLCHPSLLSPSKEEQAALEHADLWLNSFFFPPSQGHSHENWGKLQQPQLFVSFLCTVIGLLFCSWLLGKKSMLPCEQTPKQVVITHILTWTSAGGTVPCRPTKGRGYLITLCLCSECGCPEDGAQIDKALGTDVWFDYSFPFTTDHMVAQAAQIAGNQNSWAPSLTSPFTHLIFKAVFMHQQNLLPWTSPPP